MYRQHTRHLCLQESHPRPSGSVVHSQFIHWLSSCLYNWSFGVCSIWIFRDRCCGSMVECVRLQVKKGNLICYFSVLWFTQELTNTCSVVLLARLCCSSFCFTFRELVECSVVEDWTSSCWVFRDCCSRWPCWSGRRPERCCSTWIPTTVTPTGGARTCCGEGDIQWINWFLYLSYH